MPRVTRRQLLQGTAGAAALAVAPPAAGHAGALQVHTTVNGAASTFGVGDDDTALHVLRERLGLTGTKESCGHGACGACVVQLDGVPVNACLLPATALEGRSLTTVEALADHPVPRALAAEDGLQCGYCTPGFAVEGAAFHDRWRAEHPGEVPAREVVANALSGHLCRCGAYDGILRAVIAACAGRHDAPGPLAERVEALEKATGRATYTVDVALPGQLEGVVLRSPHASARVRAIDPADALALPGVRGWVRLVSESGRVRYAGQELAAVAAVDRATALAAVAKLRVDYELLPAVTTPTTARAEGAPLVYDDGHRGVPGAAEAPKIPAAWRGNLRGPVSVSQFGKPGRARRSLDELRAGGPGTLVEARYRLDLQSHTALEPHACVARWEGSKLTVHASTQAVSHLAEDLAARWGLRPKDVRVVATHVGGGFGAKAVMSMETVAAVELARVAGAPVRVVNSRAEELTVGGNRPAHEVEVALGTTPEGAWAGLSAHAWGEAGVAAGNSIGLFMRLLYEQPEKELLDYDVLTHTPPGCAFRGPGGPPAFFALEQAVDDLAHRRGEDPLAVRRRWDQNPHRLRLYDWVDTLPAWKERGPVARHGGRHARGVGLAAAAWPIFVQPNTEVRARLGADGRVQLATGMSDVGNGGRSVMVRAAAEAAGIPRERFDAEIGDSDGPMGPMVGGSRTTTSVVPAAVDAMERLLRAMVDAAAPSLPGLARVDGAFVVGGRALPWEEVAAAAGPIEVTGERPRDQGGYYLPFTLQDLTVARGVPSAVQVVEVEVDRLLGRVRVLRTFTGITCGRVVSPTLARSQVHGAVIQGLSYALYEERVIDPATGRTLTTNLEDYRIAGIADVPEMVVHFDEAGFEHVPGRVAGMSELATIGVAPAVACAVFHATGWRPTRVPLRLDRVRAGLTA